MHQLLFGMFLVLRFQNNNILDYYSGINNFRLKDYMRLEIGRYAKFEL